MKEKFLQFLKENNLYYRFESYLYNRMKIEVDEYLIKESPENYLNNAFSWRLTDEGYDYWMSLNKAWITSIVTQVTVNLAITMDKRELSIDIAHILRKAGYNVLSTIVE